MLFKIVDMMTIFVALNYLCYLRNKTEYYVAQDIDIKPDFISDFICRTGHQHAAEIPRQVSCHSHKRE